MGRLRNPAAVATLILVAALPASAARDDFYVALLHRGMAHVDAGQFDAALRELHIAAFGLVDAVPQFEIAHIYLTLAANGLKNEAEAQRSALRVVAAERVERRYGTLTIPQSARKAFETIASKLLTNDQYAFLRSSPTMAVATQPAPMPKPPAPAPRETTIVVPMPTPQPPVVEPHVAVQPLPPAPVPAPASRATSPAPQPRNQVTPQPRTPASQPRVAQPGTPRINVNTQLALADQAIERDDLRDAARIYRLVLEEPNLTHEQLLRIGEGGYRARDFADSARALARADFRQHEEPYRYYYAVALYEIGDYAAAKRELALALPYIEVTGEVARYRAMIEGAAP